jgi:hypothetical protein
MAVQNLRNAQHDHPWLTKAILALDASLRRRYSIVEYTDNPLCIFRMHVVRSSRELTLSDGTHLHRGERMVDLHFWNDQVPPSSQAGMTFSRASQMTRRTEISLQELAQYLKREPDLQDISIIRINFPAVTQRKGEQMARILARFGFEAIAESESPSLSELIRRFGENILISLVIMAYNAGAVGSDSLMRTRAPFYISRRKLESRFGRPILATVRPASGSERR